MRVGLFGNSHDGFTLAQKMDSAGHEVGVIQDIATAGDYEALIVGVDITQLPRAVEALSQYTRKGQIVIHTCLGTGVQVLDDIETTGAVVVSMAPVHEDRWAVTTADELGETIASLILGEAGIIGVAKTDPERRVLASRVLQARMLHTLADNADLEVCQLMGEDTVATTGKVEVEALLDALPAIEEPGMRRSFIETARRFGEVTHRTDIELWALQEDNR